MPQVVHNLKEISASILMLIANAKKVVEMLEIVSMCVEWLMAVVVSTETRHFEQALRVVMAPPAHCYATSGSLPATQGQRSKDMSFLVGAGGSSSMEEIRSSTGPGRPASSYRCRSSFVLAKANLPRRCMS